MKRADSPRRPRGDGADRQRVDQARVPARGAGRRSSHCSGSGLRCAARVRSGREPSSPPIDAGVAPGTRPRA
jgi:hypothetical protein